MEVRWKLVAADAIKKRLRKKRWRLFGPVNRALSTPALRPTSGTLARRPLRAATKVLARVGPTLRAGVRWVAGGPGDMMPAMNFMKSRAAAA